MKDWCRENPELTAILILTLSVLILAAAVESVHSLAGAHQ